MTEQPPSFMPKSNNLSEPPPFVPSDEQISEALNRSKVRAEEYLHDPDKSKQLLEQAVNKANRNQDANRVSRLPQSDFWAQLRAFFRLLKAYTRREYTVIPWGSVLIVAAAIVYFVSPIDLLLDWLPLLGFVDDAAVLVFVINQIRSDLDKFLIWEANQLPSNQIIDL